MSFSMNLHPVGKWEGAKVEIYSKGHGSCIQITLEDGHLWSSIALHYGGEENKEEFIKMMKEAFVKLTEEKEEKKDGRTNKI